MPTKKKLNIGFNEPFRFVVTVSYNEPVDHEESLSQAHGNADLVQEWTNRGARIWWQEQSGARDALKEWAGKHGVNKNNAASPEVVSKASAFIADYLAKVDPKNPPERPRGSGPKSVEIAADILASGDMELIRKAFAERGVLLK